MKPTSGLERQESLPKPFGRGTVWPIGRASLAALNDMGLSDSQIGAYFSVTSDDVQRLRDRHGRLAPRLSEEEQLCPGIISSLVTELLRELADGLQAACAHLEEAQRMNINGSVDPDLLNPTADQLARVGRIYSRLRASLTAADGEMS